MVAESAAGVAGHAHGAYFAAPLPQARVARLREDEPLANGTCWLAAK